MERSAEEHDLSGDPAPLGKSGDGLVDHRLIDACGDIRLRGALIQQRLNVRLGKDAAA